MQKQRDKNKLQAARQMQELFDVYYLDLGLQALVDKAREIFGRPLLVHDASFKILAFSYDIPKVLSVAEDETGDRYLSEDSIRFIHDNNVVGTLQRDRANYVRKPDPRGGTLVSMIRVKGVETAHVAIREAGMPFTEENILVVEQLSKLLSLELQKDDSFLADKHIIPSHVFAGLFEGRQADDEALQMQLHYIPWIHSSAFSILVIGGRTGSIPDSRLPPVIQAIKAFVPINRCTVYQSRIVAFLDAALVQELVRHDIVRLQAFLEANGLSAGISLEFDSLSCCGKHYRQALKAADFARERGVPVLLFERCALFLLSELIRSQYDIMDFTHPAVTALMKSDRENGSELLATLKYYLYYNHNPNAAAKKLNIHRNTLFYRINKIKDLTGISLDTMDEPFRIYLSIRMLEVNHLLELP